MSDHQPKIFICIPVFNRVQYTIECLLSIRKQTYKNWQVIICDDCSTDETRKVISQEFPEVILEEGTGSLYWAGGINRCVSKALALAGQNDFIYTLNNDTQLYPGTLQRLLDSARRLPGDLIGTLNLFSNDSSRIENSAFLFSKWQGFKRYHQFGESFTESEKIVSVDGLSGKGVLVPCAVYRKIGMYKSDLLPHYHADLEFTFRAKKTGFSVHLDLGARLLSHQGASGTGSVTSEPNLTEFIRSFESIRSTHHIPSLMAFSKLIHGRYYFPHLVKDIVFINLGFFKRFILHKLKTR